MNQVFQWINRDENISKAVQQFAQPGCHSIYGLGGSVKSMLIGKALCEINKQALVIVPSKENAAAWTSDLHFMVPHMRILDFPFVDKAVFTTTAKSIERAARQMEVLGYLRSGHAGIVLATAEEALQYIIAPQRIDDAAMDIAAGKEYDRSQFLQHLVDGGYERVDLVERRGHFSVRGDIIDVYATIQIRFAWNSLGTKSKAFVFLMLPTKNQKKQQTASGFCRYLWNHSRKRHCIRCWIMLATA